METNFSIELFTQHPFAWLAVLTSLVALFYAMRAIKKEKDVFIDNPTQISFGPYILLVPGWWSLTENTDHRLKFERTDTRYDWYAIFELKDLIDTNKSIVEEFTDEIKARHLLFDTDAGVIHEPESMKQHALANAEVARVEGTATENGIERVYFDAMLARDSKNQKKLWAESRSSVLNGLVEGPYFEYVIQNLRLN